MYSRIKTILFVAQLTYFLTTGLAHSAIRTIHKGKKDETLITRRTRIGGFLGPIIKFTRLNNQFATLVGGCGGFIFNRSFVIGGGGYGLVNEIKVGINENQLLDFGYGGLFLGYVNHSRKLIHFSVHSLIGGGGLCYRYAYYHNRLDDIFFVFEPGMDVMMNVTKRFRFGIGGSYRFVYGVNLDALGDDDIRGPSASLIFKFGKF